MPPRRSPGAAARIAPTSDNVVDVSTNVGRVSPASAGKREPPVALRATGGLSGRLTTKPD